jgi:hypothetical protein
MKQETNGNGWYGPPVDRPTVVRTERGLSIGGTRLMLYDIMDNLKWGWPHEEIREFYCLTEEQMADILTYLAEHREETEAEYQKVLAYAAEIRRRAEAELAARPPKPSGPPKTPQEAAIRAKLAEAKARLGMK